MPSSPAWRRGDTNPRNSATLGRRTPAMTPPRLGQQLTLDFFATPTLVTRTQEPLATSALFGRIPESELDRWSAPVIIPDKAPEPAPPQTFPASGPVIEDEPARNQHNYRIDR